eukprot:Em0020g507a
MLDLGDGTCIRTFIFKPSEQPAPQTCPLVMMHGFGATSLCYHKNFGALCADRTVISFDLPGFGRSSRFDFTPDAEAAEEEFVKTIERWREAMEIEQFILLGHSFGAFLACCYGIKHPSHVHHIVLVDPWGFAEGPTSENADTALMELPDGIRMAVKINKVFTFYPLTPIRVAGPLGLSLLHRTRQDLVRYLGESFVTYLYHCNAQTPSGEAGYYHMQYLYGWAKCPILPRIDQLRDSIGITLIKGSHSWLDNEHTIDHIQLKRPAAYFASHTVHAGHHLYAEKNISFNILVKSTCVIIDDGGDLATSGADRSE